MVVYLRAFGAFGCLRVHFPGGLGCRAYGLGFRVWGARAKTPLKARTNRNCMWFTSNLQVRWARQRRAKETITQHPGLRTLTLHIFNKALSLLKVTRGHPFQLLTLPQSDGRDLTGVLWLRV